MINKHISEETLLAFKQDELSPEERDKFLQHICSCNFCSEELADSLADEMITAPIDMKENILRAVRRPEVQIARKAKETSKQLQLLLYSLKVGTAAFGALLILLYAANFNNMKTAQDNQMDQPKSDYESDEDTFSLTGSIRENMDILSSSMLDFSNTIMKTEVIDYDQKEK